MTDKNQQEYIDNARMALQGIPREKAWEALFEAHISLNQALRERDEAIASHKITLDREAATTARYDTKLEKLEAALAAANRRADEAFNEGVEAAAKFVVATGHSEIATDFHLIKRPTQPEQTKKELVEDGR